MSDKLTRKQEQRIGHTVRELTMDVNAIQAIVRGGFPKPTPEAQLCVAHTGRMEHYAKHKSKALFARAAESLDTYSGNIIRKYMAHMGKDYTDVFDLPIKGGRRK